MLHLFVLLLYAVMSMNFIIKFSFLGFIVYEGSYERICMRGGAHISRVSAQKNVVPPPLKTYFLKKH